MKMRRDIGIKHHQRMVTVKNRMSWSKYQTP
jgi:hypothetical protein